MLGHVILLTTWPLKLFFKYVTRVLFPVTLTDMHRMEKYKHTVNKLEILTHLKNIFF